MPKVPEEVQAAMRTIGYFTAEEIGERRKVAPGTTLSWARDNPDRVRTVKNGMFIFIRDEDLEPFMRDLEKNRARTAPIRVAREGANDVSIPASSTSEIAKAIVQ